MTAGRLPTPPTHPLPQELLSYTAESCLMAAGTPDHDHPTTCCDSYTPPLVPSGLGAAAGADDEPVIVADDFLLVQSPSHAASSTSACAQLDSPSTGPGLPGMVHRGAWQGGRVAGGGAYGRSVSARAATAGQRHVALFKQQLAEEGEEEEDDMASVLRTYASADYLFARPLPPPDLLTTPSRPVTPSVAAAPAAAPSTGEGSVASPLGAGSRGPSTVRGQVGSRPQPAASSGARSPASPAGVCGSGATSPAGQRRTGAATAGRRALTFEGPAHQQVQA